MLFFSSKTAKSRTCHGIKGWWVQVTEVTTIASAHNCLVLPGYQRFHFDGFRVWQDDSNQLLSLLLTFFVSVLLVAHLGGSSRAVAATPGLLGSVQDRIQALQEPHVAEEDADHPDDQDHHDLHHGQIPDLVGALASGEREKSR